MVKKQMAVEKIQYALDSQLKKDTTFKPTLLPTNNPDVSHVQSKLGIANGTLDEYLNAHKALEQHRRKEGEIMKELREMQEMQQCTYKPITTELPDYIRRIAEESKKIKNDRAQIESKLPS